MTTHRVPLLLLLVLYCCCCCWAKADVLEVYLIPHSHCDAGWKKTVEQYYEEQVRTIITNAIAEVRRDPTSRRFVWAEMVYFSQWFNEQTPEMRDEIRSLVRSGVVEIVHGGWVMDDEASTLPIARVNQFTLGHEIVESLLGVRPTVAWSIDPFGSSSSSPSLLRAMGFKVYVNDRISLRLKSERSNTKELQFLWQGSPSLGLNSEIFTHTLDSWYWVPSFMNWDLGAAPVTDDNINSLAVEFNRTAHQRAAWFRTNNLLFPFGHDFAFDDANAMFSNMDLIKDHINNHEDLFNMRVRYATLNEYFAAVEADSPAGGWPKLGTVDYLPFEDIPYGGWWAGHFTSRPQLKRQMRQTDVVLRTAETAIALQFAKGLSNEPRAMMELLTRARQASALMNHHDAATGTSKQVVVDDYLAKLVVAEDYAHQVLASAVNHLIFDTTINNTFTELVVVQDDSVVNLLTLDASVPLVFYNSLGFAVCDVARVLVRIPTADQMRNIAIEQGTVPAQVHLITDNIVEVAFERCMPALGAMVVQMRLVDGRVPATEAAQVETLSPCSGEWSIANEATQLRFSQGRPTSWADLTDGGETVAFSMGFFEYSSNKSGAYLFTPQGNADPLAACPLSAKRIAGPLYESIEQIFEEGPFNDDLRVAWTLYRSPSGSANNFQQLGVSLVIESSLPIGENRELIARFTTDVNNQRRIITDNGLFEMIPHDFDSSWTDKIASNYRTLLTSSVIESMDRSRALVVIAKEPHATASLNSGELEVMLQRRLMQDDGLGMDEALNERAPFRADLFVRLETGRVQSEQREADLLQERRLAGLWWEYHASTLTPFDPAAWLARSPQLSFQGLAKPLPGTVHLHSFEVRDLFSQPLEVAVRLQHTFEQNAPGDLNETVDIDLTAIWDPSLKVIAVVERGLTLGPVAVSHRRDEQLSPIELRTWELLFTTQAH